MSITRINLFTAKPGAEQSLFDFLTSVINSIRGSQGCISCKLLQGAEDTAQLAIIEEWSSIADHRAAASIIPPEQLARAMDLFAKPPSGNYYQG